MPAELLIRRRLEFEDGTFAEMIVWQVTPPVAGSAHSYKYRFFFGREGERLVGYDNERGKGDHRHVGRRERPYRFTDVDTLVRDFLTDIEHWRSR